MGGRWTQLLRADYDAFRASKGQGPGSGLRLLAHLLVNPSLQAVALLRMANASPRWTHLLWRQILITKHALDWTGPLEIGPGLVLPHPLMVVIGPGATIGSNVTLSFDVGIGANAYGVGARIGDGVLVYPHSLIVGDVDIGAGSIIGAYSFITRDVPERHVVKRDGSMEPMRESSFSRAAEQMTT